VVLSSTPWRLTTINCEVGKENAPEKLQLRVGKARFSGHKNFSDVPCMKGQEVKN
jgi:hypothetical protein